MRMQPKPFNEENWRIYFIFQRIKISRGIIFFRFENVTNVTNVTRVTNVTTVKFNHHGLMKDELFVFCRLVFN